MPIWVKGELTSSEKAGQVAFWLIADREKLTVRQICNLLFLQRREAHNMLRDLARAIPIEERDGRWQAIAEVATTEQNSESKTGESPSSGRLV
jgi:hypothetical protein